tara:strand:- start:270 stop:434 length:165 start_codon:yes stop_codon:yes gene_type:complete
MKARSIKELLGHNKKVVAECKDLGIMGNQYLIASAWVDAVTYVIENYNCTPKEV